MKLGRPRKGQIAVLMILVVATLLGVMTLGTDVGVMYLEHVQLQKGVDAAALAGANYVDETAPGSPTFGTTTPTVNSSCVGEPDDAQRAACTYAVNNGLAVDASSLTINENVAAAPSPNIQVIATRSNLPYMFGRLVGLSSYNVGAAAIATQGATGATNGMFPMAVQCNPTCSTINLNPGAPVTFGAKFSPTGTASGNWQWLQNTNYSACGGSCGTGAAITNGMSGTYYIGGPVTTETGNIATAGSVKNGFNSLMSSCPTLSSDPCSGTGNPNNIPPTDPCLVTVAAVNFGGCTGSCNTTIEAFAQVYIEPSSTSQNITACFVKQVDQNAVASGGPSLGSLGRPVLVQ
jgi:putative Flp pilus-assembly TadE/G-like protein